MSSVKLVTYSLFPFSLTKSTECRGSSKLGKGAWRPPLQGHSHRDLDNEISRGIQKNEVENRG